MGKIIRFLTADSSIDPAIEWIAKGTVQMFDMRRLLEYSDMPTFDLQSHVKRLMQGYWFKDVGGKMRLVPTTREEWRGIAGYFIEGTSTIADMLLEDHVRAGRKVSQDTVGAWEGKVEIEMPDGSVTILKDKHGQPGQSHYGNVQRAVLNDYVPESGKLPCDWVIWTGHEVRGSDTDMGVSIPIYGPQMVGRAGIKQLCRSFGNNFHFDWIGKGGGKQRVAFFDTHADADNERILWEAKTSVAAGLRMRINERFKNGYFPLSLTAGIDQFFTERMAWLESVDAVVASMERTKPVTMLCYGASNMGKTLQLAHMARWVDLQDQSTLRS